MSPDELRAAAARYREDRARLQASHDAMKDGRLWWVRVELARTISSAEALARSLDHLADSMAAAKVTAA